MIDANYILLLVPLVLGWFMYINRCNKMYVAMASFYTIGGISAFLLTQQDFFVYSVNYGYQAVSFPATIYFIFCVVLLFEPIRLEKKKYVYSGEINLSGLKILCISFIIISIFYTIEIIPFVHFAFNVLDASDYHNEMLEQGGVGVDLSHGSVLLMKIFALQKMSRPIFVFLTCYIFSDKRFSGSFKRILCICCIVPTILDSIASSSRNTIVFAFVDFVLCFLLFYKIYSDKVKKNVVFVSLILAVFVIAIVFAFAVARFSDSDAGDITNYSLYRYAGEPIVNFNTMLWENGTLLYGNKSFTTLRAFLGYDVVNTSIQREYYSGLPYVIYCFYSIVGNFYMDFGFWGGIVICGCIGWLFYFVLNKIFVTNSITRYLIIFLYVSYTIKNYFYFSFMGSNNIYFLWNCIFVFVINKFVDSGVNRNKEISKNEF